ncbi:phage major capsid protein, P2 family [Craterilacuibacter sp. RT1T]|uniref:phage major capsid protein, P2 family n=1 Tax=Craterilacuibacter sp. RT1T TaxID=2942211 RepID=UPI0020BE2264|nr:phage major capsid protein, P2 family [Craterilacuibacter sp. RT1T]MCL6262190.1 phage major capsid protein, P2 family [Craterilacuibacter sp. RT1T]
MRKETRHAFEQYTAKIAELNQVASVDKNFTVLPSIQQTLETSLQESSEFLSRINMPGVTDMEGEKLGLGTTGTIAGRTKTANNNPRQPRSVADMVSGAYKCVKTNFDTAYPYAQLDMWAKFPDFQTKLRDVIVKQQALDRIMIGFNGVSAAENTDRETNPLLQDVNKGWLQQYREHAPERVMKEGATAGKITVGTGGDYVNLDALVFDAVNTLIGAAFAEDTELVVICGRELLADKYFPILNSDNKPSEMMAADLVVSQKRMGGLQAVRAPFMPQGKMLITKLSNLSIYWQEGARRRNVVEESNYDRIANYESTNDAYVVEVYEAGCLVENIEML